MADTDWCFTCFDEEMNKAPVDFFKIILECSKIQYCIFQQEKAPSTGTLHLQGFLITTVPRTKETLKKYLTCEAHLTHRYESREQAADYSKKEDSKVCGPFVKGTYVNAPARPEYKNSRGKGKRNDIILMIQDIKNGADQYKILEKYPSQYLRMHQHIDHVIQMYQRPKTTRKPMEVYVIVGPGGIGKSHWISETFAPSDRYELILPHNKDSPVHFDNYTNEKVLVIDEFKDWKINYSYLNQILDIYYKQFNKRYGMVWNHWTTVFILSNDPVESWYRTLEPVLKATVTRRITQEFNPKTREELTAMLAPLTCKYAVSDLGGNNTLLSHPTPTRGEGPSPLLGDPQDSENEF